MSHKDDFANASLPCITLTHDTSSLQTTSAYDGSDWWLQIDAEPSTVLLLRWTTSTGNNIIHLDYQQPRLTISIATAMPDLKLPTR